MTRGAVKKVLFEFKAELENKFSVIKAVYLYGSVVRKQNTPDSDTDVLVILDDTAKKHDEEKIFDMAYEIGLKYNCVLGVIVCSVRDWARLKSAGSPFFSEVNKEAVKI